MKNKAVILFLFLSGFLFSQSNIEQINVELHPDVEFQTIHNFGASDAWSAQFVGKWPLEKKEAMADLLFSTEKNADGTFKGIGLTTWRFNIGGGSAEQGEESSIKDEWRRAEGFLNNDGSYNWKRQLGQQWFLTAAKERGVSSFIGFVNSPPVQFTKNHKAFSSDGLSTNLKRNNYANYGVFLKDVVTHFKDSLDINFKYISPFNEPQWDWKNGKQEGSPWNNDELSTATKIIDSVFVKHHLATKLEVSEAGQIDYLTSIKKGKENRSNQVEVFFNPSSELYIGDLETVSPKFAGHSYFTTWDISKLKRKREEIKEKLIKYPNLEYWMTEYCILENNTEIRGRGKGLHMKTALYVARLIHADLTIANASSWQWWLAMTPYKYKDGLIYHDKNKEDGTFESSKLLWGLGNYSRFIRPEAKRIKIEYKDKNSLENLEKGVLVSAYKNIDNTIVVVVVNQKEEAVKLSFKSIIKQLYVTDKDFDLKLIKGNIGEKDIEISGKSINTLIL
ncbi:glycoside hydrolase family 30 protein [Polaribacter undariae]|uniref:Glycoside hydrolase family 30 protein n=1 Tax=Polaribacter sejongensis TaxID=985043 RepID=A0AAJ1VF89_9FLAO|nr:glycoside hydrolase family 30 protein [Polaribacter undariae]MDN3618104.1 glycoside hydrolase family 30 protein [Polaribacter undariae]UWD30906.1 xylanase [Polaribacter undariae]